MVALERARDLGRWSGCRRSLACRLLAETVEREDEHGRIGCELDGWCGWPGEMVAGGDGLEGVVAADTGWAGGGSRRRSARARRRRRLWARERREGDGREEAAAQQETHVLLSDVEATGQLCDDADEGRRGHGRRDGGREVRSGRG